METKRFTIYFTSDLHGYIYPTDYRSREARDIGLFKCASQFHKDGNTLIIDGGDGAIARTVAETAGNNAAILTMDSMQSARREGQTYLSVMEDNLTVLRQALGL